jgi:triphosphoribosyl-dephospho-CoA synthase
MTIGNAIAVPLACTWAVSARNPGNLHRFVDFEYVTYCDYLASAAAIAPVLVSGQPLGSMIEQAIDATRRVVNVNTNLGIVLLLAPLAAVPESEDLRQGVERLLERTTVTDAQAVYSAIRRAEPLGLGRVAEQDVADEPTLPLRDVMALAGDRDRVARQYAHGFNDVFDVGVTALKQGCDVTGSLEGAIIYAHLSLQAAFPDSLIARKAGVSEAEEANRRARAVLDAGWPREVTARRAFRDFDSWLREPQLGRNPGTTADLVTASLFVALRGGIIKLPLEIPWLAGVIDG